MEMQFKRAQRARAKLRLGLSAVSGGGKTMGSLRLAKGIVQRMIDMGIVEGPIDGKICVIDTERRSSQLYADVVPFDAMEFEPPYSVDRYMQAIDAATAPPPPEQVQRQQQLEELQFLAVSADAEGKVLDNRKKIAEVKKILAETQKALTEAGSNSAELQLEVARLQVELEDLEVSREKNRVDLAKAHLAFKTAQEQAKAAKAQPKSASK